MNPSTIPYTENVSLSPDGQSVRILDQSLLPGETVFLELSQAEELYEAIASLRVRGAPAIGIFAGYALYAPGTAVIKGLCAVTAALLLRQLGGRLRWAHLPAAVTGECVMVAGYFLYESTLLGYGLAAAGSIPANAAQGVVGALGGVVLYQALRKVPHIRRYFGED